MQRHRAFQHTDTRTLASEPDDETRAQCLQSAGRRVDPEFAARRKAGVGAGLDQDFPRISVTVRARASMRVRTAVSALSTRRVPSSSNSARRSPAPELASASSRCHGASA
ncbi:hypothetical protein WJ971_19765 [Achromobacter xylosoxidans]